MIISQNGFRDEELTEPKNILVNSGFKVVIASPKKGKCQGSKGLVVESFVSIDEVVFEDYAGAFIVGGPDSPSLMSYSKIRDLMSFMNNNERVFGAICLGPMVLASFGVIDGRTCTVYPSSEAKEMFRKHNVVFIEKNVVVDGNLVTANGPHAATEFREMIVKLLGA